MLRLFKHPQRIPAIISSRPLSFFWFLLGCIILLWGAWKIYIEFNTDLNSAEIGDSFGQINTLFSGLAFAGLIMTIVLQGMELRGQRKELRAQRRELAGQKKELEIQNKTAILQRFETSFFNFLTGFQTIKKELCVISYTKMDMRTGQYEGEEYLGPRAIKELKDSLYKDASSNIENLKYSTDERVEKINDIFHNGNEYEPLSHYFR